MKKYTELKSRIEKQITHFVEKFDVIQKEIDSNFIYAFEFGYLQDMYFYKHKEIQLKGLILMIDSGADMEVLLTKTIQEIEKILLSGKCLEKNSGTFRKLSEEIKRESNAELLSMYRCYLEMAKKEKNTIISIG